ncbi:sulfate/molybdate ABC transporter ATP-binding protein [Microbacterium immunditiarum]|uniref:Molybdate transport system ATP-binding protein n=1 Tax=Microbacterium immunditiarum TaxID=337480 RepID=A0A7Y9KL26_9MICO|nr:molybdate transport system ATP-binding protein [Microbacterium immunditiarum]
MRTETDAATGGTLDAHVTVHRRDGFRLDVAIGASPGEVVAVMGPSGAGKSTLVAAIAGLVRLDAGFVRLDGREVASATRHVPPEQRGAVLLGQDARLFPHLSARDNVAFGLRARGVTRSVAARDADMWLERVGLGGWGGRRPSELSGGQQQRVALARALATHPRLLLLDEPLTSLDAETAGDVRALLHEQLTAVHATAVVVTHDAVDAAALARRLLVVEGGVVVQEGSVQRVLAAPATRFAAAVSGLNRVVGTARDGTWTSPDAALALHAADEHSRVEASADGVALAALVRPSSVHLGTVDDAPSVPGEWTAHVVRLEPTPAGVRVHTGDPAVAVDVAADTVAALGLDRGARVRLRVDPADVRFVRVSE